MGLRTRVEEHARRIARRAPWRVHPGGDRPPPCPPDFEVGPPHFVGVGAQKAGTSWWFSLIADHPEAYHPPGIHKERHYFNRYWRGGFGEADVADYHRWFPRPAGSIIGEWTPRYMADAWTPPLLRAAAPHAKLLVSVRDPIERYCSGVTHHLRRGARPGPDLAALAFSWGLYHQQLARLLQSFDAADVLVLQYERCVVDPAPQLRRTYEFLGVDASFLPEALNEPVGETPVDKLQLDEATRRALVDAYVCDVRRLATDFPDIDISLWLNFAPVI